jgi:hypothetical protein
MPVGRGGEGRAEVRGQRAEGRGQKCHCPDAQEGNYDEGRFKNLFSPISPL